MVSAQHYPLQLESWVKSTRVKSVRPSRKQGLRLIKALPCLPQRPRLLHLHPFPTARITTIATRRALLLPLRPRSQLPFFLNVPRLLRDRIRRRQLRPSLHRPALCPQPV